MLGFPEEAADCCSSELGCRGELGGFVADDADLHAGVWVWWMLTSSSASSSSVECRQYDIIVGREDND
jgi:hypothetical protein